MLYLYEFLAASYNGDFIFGKKKVNCGKATVKACNGKSLFETLSHKYYVNRFLPPLSLKKDYVF